MSSGRTAADIVKDIRQLLDAGEITEHHLAGLLWERVQARNPKASFGATSDLIPDKRGYVVVYRDYQQAKTEH